MEDKRIIDVGCIVRNLKELLDSVIERFSSIQVKKENSIDNIVVKYSADKEFLEKLDCIVYLTDELVDRLEVLKDFQDEYLACLSLQNMVEYVVGDIRRYILFSSFIKDLIFSFYNLIISKIDLMKKGRINDYNKVLSDYNLNLYKQEEFFYFKIYENTHEHDDLIKEVTNILYGTVHYLILMSMCKTGISIS